MALYQPAWQSSDWRDSVTGLVYVAELSVDGNKNTSISQFSCSVTDVADVLPWWAVDLGEPTYVYGINLTNTEDNTGMWVILVHDNTDASPKVNAGVRRNIVRFKIR